MPAAVQDELRHASWSGTPNSLSSDHHAWPVIDEVAAATVKRLPPDEAFWSPSEFDNSVARDRRARRSRCGPIIHQRRSAVALDGRTGIAREAFYQILLKVMPGSRQVPFTTLPWRPRVDLLLFVHRVEELTRDSMPLCEIPRAGRRSRLPWIQPSVWRSPPACPVSLPLVFLQEGDARRSAQQTSCNQEIAADGVFAAAMLADYRALLDEFGPWFYRRLFWETGVIGQVLYLEAEASGIRGTGIGCFFDDATHKVFGLTGDRYQVLYHFTMGGPVDDRRLQTHPPYEHLERTHD